MKKTCFVISPIGTEGSDVRKDADDFLNYVIKPALEKYDFEVVRADRIPRPSVITADIIRLVQEADICIIDITNSNPNVFYECGRRHETGRPFIQMVRAGMTTNIPFDVAGIRTLQYDASTTPKARAAVKELQSYIDEIVKSGFGERAAGYTMASLGDALDRIERKLTRLTQAPQSQNSPTGMKIDILTSHPKQAFLRLFEAGNFNDAFGLVNRILTVSGQDEYLYALGVLARAGFDRVVDSLLDCANSVLQSETPREGDLISVAASLKEYFTNTGRTNNGIPVLEKLFTTAAESGKFKNTTLASLANAIGLLAWPGKDYVIGAKYEELAVTLNPAEPTFWYNKSMTHEVTGEEEKLAAALKGLARCQSLRPEHAELLRKHGVER